MRISVNKSISNKAENLKFFQLNTAIKLVTVTTITLVSLIDARPYWVDFKPSGYKYDYFVGKGTHSSRTEAEKIGLLDAVSVTTKASTMRVTATSELKSAVVESQGSDVNTLSRVDNLTQEIRLSGEGKTIYGLQQVESFCDQQNDWSCWVLVSLPKASPLETPSSLSRISEPLWRSALLPGWGQLNRNAPGMGYSMMSLFLVSLAGGLISNSTAVSATHDATISRTQTRRDYFNEQSTNLTIVRNIFWIATGFIYTWNIIDAVIVKDPRYFVKIDPNKTEVALVAKF
jgi:hypothetical protein